MFCLRTEFYSFGYNFHGKSFTFLDIPSSPIHGRSGQESCQSSETKATTCEREEPPVFEIDIILGVHFKGIMYIAEIGM